MLATLMTSGTTFRFLIMGLSNFTITATDCRTPLLTPVLNLLVSSRLCSPRPPQLLPRPALRHQMLGIWPRLDIR